MAEQNPPKVKRTPVDFDPFAKGQDKKIKRTPVDFDPFAGSPPQTPPTDPFAQAPPQEQEGLTQGPSGSVDAYGDGLYQTSAAASPSALAAGSSASSSRPSVTEPLPPFGQQPPAPEQVAPPERNTAMETAMSTGDWKSSQALEAAQPKGLLDEEQRKNLQAEWDKLMVPGPKDTWQPPQRAKDIQKALETDKKVREIPAKLVNSALAAKDSPVFAQREDEVGPAQQYDWQNVDDPRRRQLEKEAVDYAQQDQTIFRYDPRKRQSMIDQGGWDNAKEASYQSSIISHAQEVVAGKQILLQRGIDSGAIDPQQAEQMKADIQSRANYVKAGWEAVQKLDPKTIQEKLNEQNQQVADIQHSMGLTGAGTATAQKIGEGAVSGVGNTMIKPLLMAYSKVFGDDSTYSTADRAIDAIAEVTSEMDSHVASHYKKQLFEKNEDGTTDFNPQSIVPQLAGGITELVPFLALSEAGAAAGASEGALFGNAALGASIGSKAAIFGTMYADTYDRYIRDTMAKDKNITEAEAKEGANIAATGTALLFAVNPNLDMAATQKKVGAKVFSQMADGVTKKDIVANLLKEIGKGGTTQAGLNFGVLAADNVANDAVNQLAGTNLPTEQTAHELLSSTAGAFLIGGALALGHGGSVSDMRAKAMRSAMEHPEAAKQVVKESSIPSEQKAQAYNNIDNARRDYVGNNLKRTGITDAKATQFVDNEAQIRQIKEHIKENPPSDVVKEAKSDPRDAQLEKLYKEQRDILGIPEPEAKPSEAKKEPVALPKAKEEQPTEKKSDGNRSDRNGSVKKRADGAPEGGGKQPSAELPNNNRMGSGNPGNEASASAGAGQVPERGPGDAQGSQRGTKADQRVNAGDVVLPGRVLRGVDGDNAGGVSGTTEEVGAKDIYTQAPTAESPTTGVQVAEGKKRNAVVDAALEIAPKNDGATKSEAPTPDKVQGESVEPTATTGDGEAVRAADVAKPTSEVERLSDDALLGGQAEKNRKAGKREIAGQEYKRQAPQDAPEGKEGKVQFSEGVDVPFQYALMDADAIQPSHAAGRRNPLHFIPEAQPKPRTDAESQLAASRIAQAPDIDKVGSSPNAYSGAPIVNARGEVVQGNNRATGLKEHYKQGGTSYKQDLAKNADQYGLTAEQVDGMKNPILVRRIHTSDVKSIELGNYDAKDIESGGKGSIDPVAVSARIPTSAKASIAERLFGNSGDATLKSAIRESYSDLTKMLEPYLNPAQRNTLYSKGTNEPSARGMQELESLVKHFLFDGGAPELSEVFESLPHHAQAGITAAMPQILSSPESQAITKEVQNAVMSASAFRVSGVESFGAWAAQADAFGPSATEVYTPTEMAMAKLMAEAKTTKAVREKLNQYAGSTKPSEATMFDGASEGKSLQQAAEDVFGITSPKQNDQSADKSSGAKAPAGAVQAAEGSGVDAAKAGEGSNTRNAKDGSGELVQEQRGEAPQVPLTGVAHVDSVTKALSNLAPDLKVTVHKNGKAFNAALDGRGDPNSAAFYDRDAGEIHINLSRAKDNTLFHEAAHVVLAAAVDNNPVMLHELFKQLEGTPEFEKYKKFGALYGDKPISTRMEEAVAEYMADIGSGKARTSALPKSLYQKLKQWIKDMLAKLGFRAKDIKLDPTNLRKFAEDFAKAMTEGIKVRGEKVEAKGGINMQLNPEKVAAAMRAEGFDAKAAKAYLEGENITKEDKKAILLAMERAGSKAERSDLKKQVREAVKEAKANLKLADKRANQGYRQGMAEGQLGGEIEGKKAGRKEGALEQRKLNRELADRVEGILDPLRSEVSPGQAKALVKAANKVQSDIQLENFQRVADKIIDDAEYGDRLDEADSIRSGIKKKLKSKEASKRNTLEQMGLFKEFSQLDPSKVADLAEYTSIANRVRRNLDAIQVRNGEIQNADLAISNDELSGYLAREITAQREQAKKDLIVQYEQMVKDGLLSGDLTLDQMKDIINASEDDLEAALEKSGADDKLTTLRDFAEAKLGAMSTGIFTANTPAEAEVLKNIMQIDPQRLPAKDLVRLNNVLNNIQVNADYSGSGFMSSVGKEHQNAADLVKAISGVRVQEASGDLDRLRTEAARIDAMTLDNKVASEARRLMGSDAYGDASHRVHAIGEHNLHDAEQEMKRLGLKAKDDTKPNRNLMFVYSWVIQNEGGTPAQQQAFFQNQKAMIAQSIERLMDKSASSENKERGAIMKEAFKIAEDAKTPEEVRSNLEAINPALAKFVDWGVNKGKEVQERSFENKKINDNEVPTVVNNWTHAKQRSLMPTSVDDLGKNTFVGRNLDRSGSRSMISRVNSLGQGRVLDGDFISNLLEGWHQNNYANETQSDRMLMERMLNNTDVIQALGQHNVELLRQQAKRKTEGDKSAAQPMSKAEKKAVRAAHRVIRMGSGIALKSLTQLVKQPVVLTNVSTVLGKDIDLLFHPMDDVAGAMAGRMIEGRGEYMAGIEPTGRTITKGEAPLSNTPWQAVERGLTKVADASDKLYRPLTGADVWSAKQTWKAFYLKSLRDRGMWKKGDSVVNDEQAAAYANHMTEKLQGSNSITTMAQVYQTKGMTGLLRYMYMPFTSFSAQTRSRMVNDIQKIRLGTSDQKKEGAQGLGATVIEQGTYNAAKVAIYAATLAAAKMAIQGLFGYDDDKDKDGNDIERDSHTTSKFLQAFAEDVMAPGWPQMMKSAAELIINDIATTIHPATTNKEGKRVPYEGPAYVYGPSKYGQSDLSQLGAAASAVQMGQKLWDNRDYWDGVIYETTRGGDSPYSPTEVERLTRLGLPTTSNPDRQGPTREETLRLTPKERAAMVAVNVSRMGALLGFSETQINTMMNELEKETKRNIGKRAKLNAFQKYSYPKSLVNDMVEVQAANYNAATDKVAAMKEADKAFREKMSPAQYNEALKMYSTARANPDMPFFYIRLANKAGVDDRAQALFDKYTSVPKEEHQEVIRNATIAGVLTDDVREKFKKLMLESKAEDAVNRTKAKE